MARQITARRFLFSPLPSLLKQPAKRCKLQKNKTHWILTPTRRLRAQHIAAALKYLDAEQVFPAGADEDGSDLYTKHMFRIIEKRSHLDMEYLCKLEENLEWKLRQNVWRAYGDLSAHQRTIFRVYVVQARESLAGWGSNGCVAVATHDYFLKVCAGTESLPVPLKQPAGVVFQDEGDEASVPSFFAAASGEALPESRPPSLPVHTHTPTCPWHPSRTSSSRATQHKECCQ